VLEPYKTTIDRWVCPDVMSNQDISVAKAKRAISDYKKAIGRPEGLAELTVFYCESCMNLLGYCGKDDEGYFNALVCMFEKIGDSHRLNDPPFSHDRLRQTNDVSATVAETIKTI
jgi:hypothetical protein